MIKSSLARLEFEAAVKRHKAEWLKANPKARGPSGVNGGGGRVVAPALLGPRVSTKKRRIGDQIPLFLSCCLA